MAQMFDNGDAEVSISEQGSLKYYDNSPVLAVGYNISSFTVPSGKKWILKGAQLTSSNLVATVKELIVSVQIGAGSISLLSFDDGSTSKLVYNPTMNLVLESGTILKVVTQLTAYTSGTVTHKILIQEMDI